MKLVDRLSSSFSQKLGQEIRCSEELKRAQSQTDSRYYYSRKTLLFQNMVSAELAVLKH